MSTAILNPDTRTITLASVGVPGRAGYRLECACAGDEPLLGAAETLLVDRAVEVAHFIALGAHILLHRDEIATDGLGIALRRATPGIAGDDERKDHEDIEHFRCAFHHSSRITS